MSLDEYRKQIDEIDRELITLFSRRMEVAAQIGAYKKAHGIPVLDTGREQEKLRAISAMAPEGLEGYACRLYATLFSLSREYQTREMAASLRCGLLGEHLEHSYSPMLHRLLGNYGYSLFEVPADGLAEFLRHGEWDAINVTIPYKKAVVPYCGALSPTAERLGSVNTLLRRPDGTLYGDNTDYAGFAYTVHRQGIDPAGKKALVLGSGGASVTVCAVLRDLGAAVTVISRSGEETYETLFRHRDAKLIVNTTPVGMYPDTSTRPIDLTAFPECECVFDLIYNPVRTALLQQAEALGIPHIGGLSMLCAQARRSSECFTGLALPETLTETCIHAISRQQENIVLIGMPGSGKSTVARLLGKRLNRQVWDADDELSRRAGMPIPEIFRTKGEAWFRSLETEVLSELGKKSGIILSTGGGCVTREENYPLLHQNGTVFWLQREIGNLPLAGRPISAQKGAETIYAEREALYRRFAALVIDNNGTPEAATDAILEAWK